MADIKVPRRLISLKAAAHKLGVAPGTLGQWYFNRKNLSFYKIGGGVKCDLDEINEYILRSRVLPLNIGASLAEQGAEV